MALHCILACIDYYYIANIYRWGIWQKRLGDISTIAGQILPSVIFIQLSNWFLWLWSLYLQNTVHLNQFPKHESCLIQSNVFMQIAYLQTDIQIVTAKSCLQSKKRLFFPTENKKTEMCVEWCGLSGDFCLFPEPLLCNHLMQLCDDDLDWWVMQCLRNRKTL